MQSVNAAEKLRYIQNMPCVLVSCCGLPAAGKTSFCHSVVRCASSPHPSPSPATPAYGVNVTHVCFDKYIDLACQRARRQPQHAPDQRRAVGVKSSGLRNEAENRNTGEKQADELAKDAQHVVGKEDSTVRRDNDTGAVDETQEREEGTAWWHEGRRDAMAVVEALAARNPSLAGAVTQEQEVREGATTHGNDRTRTGLDGSGSTEEERERYEDKQSVHVVLVDDNMHFRSMRHEVLRLAREHECGYAQIYFPTAVDVAIERDARRKVPVSEAVISKMAEKLQPPDPHRFSWERHTVVVQSQDGDSVDSAKDRDAGGSATLEGAAKTVGAGGAAMPAFWEVIAAAAEDPVPSLPTAYSTSEECKDADREATSASILHRLDLDMREAAKRLAEHGARAGLARDLLRGVMNACAVSRKTTLRWARASEKATTAHKAGGDDSPSCNYNGSPDARHCDRRSDNGSVGCFSDSGGSAAIYFCSSAESVINTHRRSSGSGESMARGASPLDAFVVEFERAIRGVDGLDASVRGNLVEAVKGMPPSWPRYSVPKR